jgi:tetratricopeptide (TPR) repeat protein
MKTKLVFIAFILMATLCAANDGRYIESMTKNINLVYKAQTVEELQLAVNAFDRIGGAEKDKWEPYYYASFGYVMMANRVNDLTKKDSYLDQAKAELDKATSINPSESEIIALDGFITMLRITVDPATRGPQFSGLAMQLYEKALKLNPENPRALALMAQMQFGTARFFNSSTDEACATSRHALEKFSTFKPAGSLAPAWGKQMAEDLLQACK